MRWFFFFNDTATTEIYTLSLHDALPICIGVADEQTRTRGVEHHVVGRHGRRPPGGGFGADPLGIVQQARSALAKRSEEHTSELQSRQYLVCRLLLEKKKTLLH